MIQEICYALFKKFKSKSPNAIMATNPVVIDLDAEIEREEFTKNKK